MKRITIGLVGYASWRKISKAIEKPENSDLQLNALFSRKHQKILAKTDEINIVPYQNFKYFSDKIDVMIVMEDSENELLECGPEISSMYNAVYFGTGSDIPGEIKEACQKSGKKAIVGVSWKSTVDKFPVEMTMSLETTAEIMLAYARACYNWDAEAGCYSVSDVPVELLKK